MQISVRYGRKGMKYKEIYLWGRSQLEQAGVGEYALDARLLLEHVCHTNRNTLLVHGDREVSEEEEIEYRRGIELRKSRIPLQHITGVCAFRSACKYFIRQDSYEYCSDKYDFIIAFDSSVVLLYRKGLRIHDFLQWFGTEAEGYSADCKESYTVGAKGGKAA